MATIKVDLTGDYRSNIYSAARRLLAGGAGPGLAGYRLHRPDPLDTIETWRNGRLSMSGTIGDCAGLMTISSDKGNPSLRLAKWRPIAAVGEPATGPSLLSSPGM